MWKVNAFTWLCTPPKPHPPTLPRELLVRTYFYCLFLSHKYIGTASEKRAAIVSDAPPPKPPRRTSSVTMKKPIIPSTQASTDDAGHVYEAID